MGDKGEGELRERESWTKDCCCTVTEFREREGERESWSAEGGEHGVPANGSSLIKRRSSFHR